MVRQGPGAAQRVTALLLLASVTNAVNAEGLIDALVRRFAQSDFEFVRAQSDVPFLPAAWATVSGYQEGEFTRPDGSPSEVTYQQWNLSQGAFLPLPIGRRDAFVIGDWLSATRFHLESGDARELDVFSVSIPVGWARQVNPEWQLAAFAAPLGSTSRDDGWYWETLGGVFARYVRNDRLAWLFGAYFDVGPLEDFYTPYLGATFLLNQHWSIDVVLPWPGVTYAPNPDMLFRLGVSPSGASWSAEQGARRPRIALSAWNFGLTAEHRLAGNLWWAVEAGVSGIRGLSIVGSDFQLPDTHLKSAAYASLTINLRPEAPSAP